MNARIAILYVAISGLLLGCASNPYNTKAKVAAGVAVETDSFKGVTTIVGPPMETFPRRGIAVYRLRGWTKSATVQLYVHYMANNWAFYNEAYDSNQNRLTFTEIARDVDTSVGGIDETFAATIDISYLQKYSASGITVRFYGKNDPDGMVLSVPPYYVEAFLDASKPK